MNSVPELIEAFGGNAVVAEIIGKKPSTVSEMKRNRSIAVTYWPRLIDEAQVRGIDGVTAELLMRLHAREAAE